MKASPTLPTRRALIMGASSGLGYAIAKKLSDDGVEICLHAREGARLKTAAAKLDTQYCSWDLTNPDAAQQAMRRLQTETGFFPDILVCNCGGPPLGNFTAIDRNSWNEQFDTILVSAMDAIRTFLPHMKKQNWGRIIAISSVSAVEPMPDIVLSSVLRAGLQSLVKCLATDLASHGVTINSICPGFTETERLTAFKNKIEAIQKQIPAGRLGCPEEIAAAASFLVSEASAYITGQALVVDGGYTKRS